MGCNLSHPRILPGSPVSKTSKLVDSTHSESPTSALKSPLDSPQYPSKPRLTFGPSNSLRITTPTTFGTLDIGRGDQSLREANSPAIIIKGLAQVSTESHNDFKEKSDSQDGTPGLDRSLKKDFTFFGQNQSVTSSYEASKQTDRVMTSHQRPSGFFVERKSSHGNVLKLSTFAGPHTGPLSEETDGRKRSLTKSMVSSLLIAEQDIHPDTPGFKPAGSKLVTQMILETQSPMLSKTTTHRKSEESYRYRSKDEAPENSVKIFPRTVQVVPQEQDTLQSPGKEPQTRSMPHAPESPKKTGDDGRNKLKKMFTKNLLDLVAPKKTVSTPAQSKESEPKGSPIIVSKKPSVDLYEELSLSLTSNMIPGFSGDRAQDRRKSKKMSTLKLNNLEFLNNGEMISPINHIKYGNQAFMTSPVSMQASFSKQGLEVSEFLDERTLTNAENISRGDFDKYSFMAEVKEIEVDESATVDSNAVRHQPIKKSIFNGKKVEIRDSPSLLLEEEVKPKLQKAGSLIVDTPNPKKFVKNKTYHNIDDAYRDNTSNLSPVSCKSSPFLFEPHRVVETMSLDKSVDENGYKKINEYTLLHELGRGNFAKVKLGMNLVEGIREEYAVKIVSRKKLKKKLFAKQKDAFTQLHAEIAIMKKMSHPNIVQLYEVIDAPDEDKLYLIMEYASKGAVMSKKFWSYEREDDSSPSTDSIFKPIRPLPEDRAKQYFRDLVLGMHYMHHCVNAVHRDIKPENLLIDQNDVLKIADFNISQMFESKSSDIVKDDAGTKLFLAPEAWVEASFRGKPADIWAAGATLYYFLYGKAPFVEKFGKSIREVILNNEPQFPEGKAVNPRAIELIKACLVKDPKKRVTVEDLMRDPWITDDGENPLSNEEFEMIGTMTMEDLLGAMKVKLPTAVRITGKLLKSLGSARKTLMTSKSIGSIGEVFEKSNR